MLVVSDRKLPKLSEWHCEQLAESGGEVHVVTKWICLLKGGQETL
jgi:hypothetical protein